MGEVAAFEGLALELGRKVGSLLMTYLALPLGLIVKKRQFGMGREVL